jgi:hypothetical protein
VSLPFDAHDTVVKTGKKMSANVTLNESNVSESQHFTAVVTPTATIDIKGSALRSYVKSLQPDAPTNQRYETGWTWKVEVNPTVPNMDSC